MKFEIKSITKNEILYGINIAYFALAFIQILAEVLNFRGATLLFGICSPILLLALYYKSSIKRDVLFYWTIGLLVINNILASDTYTSLFFYEDLSFILLRIFSLVLIFKLTNNKNYLHIVVASFPFLVIFFYLISATNEITNYEFNLLITQSILISVLGGISVVNYLKNDNRQHSWLLISTLLFVGFRFIVFIERYFTSDSLVTTYKSIEIILSVFAFYTFYKFVIAAESNENKNYIINNDER